VERVFDEATEQAHVRSRAAIAELVAAKAVLALAGGQDDPGDRHGGRRRSGHRGRGQVAYRRGGF
jgi:hypothetical protein